MPSTRMRQWRASSKAAFRFAAVLPALFFLTFALSAETLSAEPPAASGLPPEPSVMSTFAVGDDDVITLLGLNLGGYDIAVAAWSNMNPSEKQTLRDQTVRIARMARGAELDALPSDPQVERTLRWAVSSFLAETWERKIASGMDLSETAARAFYEANKQGYMDSGAVRYIKAVYPLSRRDAALRAKRDLQKASLSRLKNSVAVGWTEYDAGPLSGALRAAPAGEVMGPLETPEGYVLFQVLEQREEAAQPFEKCRARVIDDMIRAAVTERLEKLNSGIK